MKMIKTHFFDQKRQSIYKIKVTCFNGCRFKRYITSISKNKSIKQRFPTNKHLHGRSIDLESISLRECTVYYLSLLQQIPLYIKHICCRTKTYVQITYRNPVFFTDVLHKRHGQFLGAHSRIFFLNKVGDVTFFNSSGKMSHIFGPRLDKISDPDMTVLLLLPCRAVLFLRL